MTPDVAINSAESITANSEASAPQLNHYLDYRRYLSDFFDYKQAMTSKERRPYSYSTFAAGADLKTPQYLRMVIQGQRNLTDETITKFCRGLGFQKQQADEFRLLVHYTQAKDPAERNVFLRQLSEHRVLQKMKLGEIRQEVWDRVPDWVTWTLYALIDQEGVKFRVQDLIHILRYKAAASQIQTALDNLLASGQVILHQDGTLQRQRQLMADASEIPVDLVRKIQAELMFLGLESLFQDSPVEREFGTLTLSLTAAEFEDIRFQLRKLRKAIHKENTIRRMKNKGERVYQMNLQLYPVTNSSKIENAEKTGENVDNSVDSVDI